MFIFVYFSISVCISELYSYPFLLNRDSRFTLKSIQYPNSYPKNKFFCENLFSVCIQTVYIPRYDERWNDRYYRFWYQSLTQPILKFQTMTGRYLRLSPMADIEISNHHWKILEIEFLMTCYQANIDNRGGLAAGCILLCLFGNKMFIKLKFALFLNRLRKERLLRIERYKQRLSLLLPTQIELIGRNEATAGSWYQMGQDGTSPSQYPS